MKFRNVVPGGYAMFWDEGNPTKYPWHVKGYWKRYGRLRSIKRQLDVLWEVEMHYMYGDLFYDEYDLEWW